MQKLFIFSIILLLLIPNLVFAGPWDDHGYLKVSANKHYLEYEDGTEFFWLGDTAWHLPSLDRNEVNTYLENRVSKGFNVVMMDVTNMDSPGLDRPNYAGVMPFSGSKPYSSFSPNEAFWEHIDYIVERAAQNNLYVVLIAAWGSRLNENYWTDPYNHVYQYGQFLGNRYKNEKNAIFCAAGEFQTVMGSYTPLTSSIREGYLRRTGQGIDSTCNSKQLITIHGNPGRTGDGSNPSDFFKQDDWLDFYGNQNWQHPKYIDDQINHDFGLTNPTKPTFNMEPGYEDGFAKWSAACDASGTPWGQRFMAYWSVFNGAFGHSYGHDRIASMSGPSSDPWHNDNRGKGILDPAALDDTGGSDMIHLKNLMESKPINSRIPDQSIITSAIGIDTGDSPNKIFATRDKGNNWAFVYLTKGGSVTVDMTKISGSQVKARWYNPKNGAYSNIGTYSNSGTRQFTASSSGEDKDWVLVLEKVSAFCGDSTCNNGETCSSCAADCPTGSGKVCCSGTIHTGDCCGNSDCTSPKICTNHVCSKAPGVCGDDTCNLGETCSSCAADCPTGSGEVCCSGTIYTGDCCDNSACTSPDTCNGHVCSKGPNVCEDLVLLMHFDDDSSTVFDYSIKSNNGTVNGATHKSTGKFDGAFEFDGVDDFISVPHDSSLANAEGTISFWFKLNDLTENVLFSKDFDNCAGDCGHLTMAYNLAWMGPNKLALRLQNDGNGEHYNLSSDNSKLTIVQDTWYHLGLTFGSGGIHLYLNGVEHDSDSSTKGMQNNQELIKLGVIYNDGSFFNGFIDDVGLWSRSLSANEVKSIFDSQSAIKCGQIHKADKDYNYCVDLGELNPFLEEWKNGIENMNDLVEAIKIWKSCS